MQSSVSTVEDYLDLLVEDRRQTVSRLRSIILEHLPPGYEEGMQFGMIGYYIPLGRYPDTYNGQPLSYVALASQKNYISLYLNCVYADPQRQERFREEWTASGKKLNMGKSCVRFRKLDDLPLDVIAGTVASTPVDEFIQLYEASRR